MIQRHVARHDVAASFAGGKLDAIVPPQRLNRFRLNQRELVIRLRLVERAQLQRVAITIKPHAWNRHHLSKSLRWPLGSGCNMNRFHRSVPHRAPPTIYRLKTYHLRPTTYASFSTTAIASSSASMATSASSLVTISGGAMRTVLGPHPRNSTPRSNAASTMRSRSLAPYSRVVWS